MAVQDAPDYTLWTQTIIPVAGDAVPESPANETPIVEVVRLPTDSTEYAEVVSWTVSETKSGILAHVDMESDDYTHTRFKLEIGGTEMFKDQQLEATLSLIFPDLRLAAEAVVKLSAKSSDGTAVNVDGVIIGKEVG